MSDWYIERGNQERGPFTWEKVRSLAAAGRIRPDDLVREGHGHPRRADEIKDLEIQEPPLASPSKRQVSRTGLRQDNFQPQPIPATGPITIPRFFIGLGLIVVALTGWVFWSESQNGQRRPLLPAPVVAIGPLPTDAECRDFADRIIRAATEGGIPEESLIDYGSLGDRALAGLPAPATFRDGFVAGARQSGFFKRVREGLGDSVTMRLVRIREMDREKRVVVRILSDAGVNYFEFIVEKEASGTVRAKDLYIYLAGERISETMRSMALPLVAQLNRGALEKLRGEDQAIAVHLEKMQAMNEANIAGNSAEVLAIYSTLPPEVQKLKVVQLQRYKAVSSSLGGKDFTEAVDDIQRQLGDDPRLALLYVDNYVLKKEFEKAHAAMNRLLEATGDSYIHVMRANTFAEEGRFDEAVTAARRATDGEPDLTVAWMTRLLAEIKAKKFDDVATTLREADRHLTEVNWSALWELPDYAPFAETPQYKKWADEEP